MDTLFGRVGHVQGGLNFIFNFLFLVGDVPLVLIVIMVFTLVFVGCFLSCYDLNKDDGRETVTVTFYCY